MCIIYNLSFTFLSISKDFHMVMAKRPLCSPNFPEEFTDGNLAEFDSDGHYTNHLFDIPNVT